MNERSIVREWGGGINVNMNDSSGLLILKRLRNTLLNSIKSKTIFKV